QREHDGVTSTGRCLFGRTRYQNRANPTTGGWSPHPTYWRALLGAHTDLTLTDLGQLPQRLL
ncbi:MAG: hypothetical protein WBA45_15990, partial [Microthrixaceae bacterium]